jgi:hypothetical protein
MTATSSIFSKDEVAVRAVIDAVYAAWGDNGLSGDNRR